MDNIGYVSLTQAAMLERALDVTANNIANSGTDGFRGSRSAFEALVENSLRDGKPEAISYPYDRSYVDLSPGALTLTGNSLDVAIDGRGWFAYRNQEDQLGLGRDGRLSVSDAGFLQTTAGSNILDAAGAPVMIPQGAGVLTIAADGSIMSEAGVLIGQIGVFDEPQIGSWQPASNGMFTPPSGNAELVPALDFRVVQGFSEGSNVNTMVEMTRMISVQRAYERSLNSAGMADELRQDTIKRLGSPAT